MAKITDKIKKFQEENPNTPYFSFEFFPPKTDLGVVNLYERFDRMAALNPMWVDVTWGAGGSTADKTMEICVNALQYHGLDVMMHLTCTNMPKEKLQEALQQCKDHGIRNILALRGDPPAGINKGEWKQVEGGFAHATDLIAHIKKEFGDWFCIGCAGYPENHMESTSKEDDLKYMKMKVDAGADLVVTQLFYDNQEFLNFVKACRLQGITVPILPGIMPIQSYAGFKKMTELCKTKVPPHISEALEKVKDDESKVKDYGVECGVEMCKELLANGVPGLHFYTLNLESAVLRIIDGLKIRPENKAARPMPWKQAVTNERSKESVRPIFWANRPASYIKRTKVWDDFPNGRFGSRASPAYGRVEDVFISFSKESEGKMMEERLAMWGEPKSLADVAEVFNGFLTGKVKKLPWCAESPSAETNFLLKQLKSLNAAGLFTINSQPRCNAALSTDPYLGWGPENGFVYQKSYVEFFCSKETMEMIMAGFERERKLNFLSYTAVNSKGDTKSNVPENSVNAVTWGVFPGQEIIQPTVVDRSSFMAWKDEAFALWNDWISCVSGDDSKKFITEMRDNYYLMSIVDNDFVRGDLCNSLIDLVKAPKA